MALRLKGISPQKMAILLIIMLINFSIVFYIIYNNFLKPAGEPAAYQPTPPPISNANQTIVQTSAISSPLLKDFPKLPEIPTLNLDDYFFANPKFINLNQRGELPVEPGILGRPNPFIPFSGLPTSTPGF